MEWLNRNPTATLRVCCLAGAGASISESLRWAELLPASIELCGIELPGRGKRWHQPPIRDFQRLIDLLILDLIPHLDMPLVLALVTGQEYQFRVVEVTNLPVAPNENVERRYLAALRIFAVIVAVVIVSG